MADLSMDDVAALARAVDLPIGQDDLPEVTHRLNATLEVVRRMSHPDLDRVVPLPAIPPGKNDG